MTSYGPSSGNYGQGQGGGSDSYGGGRSGGHRGRGGHHLGYAFSSAFLFGGATAFEIVPYGLDRPMDYVSNYLDPNVYDKVGQIGGVLNYILAMLMIISMIHSIVTMFHKAMLIFKAAKNFVFSREMGNARVGLPERFTVSFTQVDDLVEFDSFTVDGLKEQCRMWGLKATGLRGELLNRVQLEAHGRSVNNTSKLE